MSANESAELGNSLTTTFSPLSEDNDDNFSDDDGGAFTTAEPNTNLFTETVFGSRPSFSSKKSSSINKDNVENKKLKRGSSNGGVKGGSASAKLVKFNRLTSSKSSGNLSGKSANLAASGNAVSSSFFSRYKYASHQSAQGGDEQASTPAKSAKLTVGSLGPRNPFLGSPFRSNRNSHSSLSSPSSSSSHLPFTSHLSSSAHRPKHYRAQTVSGQFLTMLIAYLNQSQHRIQ